MATISAIGLLVGLVIPVVGAAAALWMVGYFVVATLTHVVRKDMVHLDMPLLFFAIVVGLGVLRWGDATPILAFVGR
jgi:DoxX-like protein